MTSTSFPYQFCLNTMFIIRVFWSANKRQNKLKLYQNNGKREGFLKMRKTENRKFCHYNRFSHGAAHVQFNEDLNFYILRSILCVCNGKHNIFTVNEILFLVRACMLVCARVYVLFYEVYDVTLRSNYATIFAYFPLLVWVVCHFLGMKQFLLSYWCFFKC